MRLIILILCFTSIIAKGQNTKFEIKEASVEIQMPNEEWNLASKKEGELTAYVFKRNPILNADGVEIIPAIMIYAEDGADYDQDVVTFSVNKRLQFQGRGVIVDKVMTHEDKDYPIVYKNSLIAFCSYNDGTYDHILYMIHLLTKNNRAVQIYMDMTKDLAAEYSKEFWTAMKSIKFKQ